MKITVHDIRLSKATPTTHKILSVFCTIRIYLVSEKARFGKTLRFAAKKICLTPVRKDTILDDPSRKTIRTNPSTVSEGKPMVQPFWLSEDYPVTGVNICLAASRNGPQKIKPYVVGCSPRVRLCEVQRHCLFLGMYVLTKTFRNLHKRDDSTPYPRSNFNLSIGVS
jgi:hypothetical protein